jgi:receptor expression-enhancing protein 5/6
MATMMLVIFFIFLFIIFDFQGRFFSDIIIFCYPAYKSLKAVDKCEKHECQQWLSYWYLIVLD